MPMLAATTAHAAVVVAVVRWATDYARARATTARPAGTPPDGCSR